MMLVPIIAIALLITPLALGAQERGKVHRIGFLALGSPSPQLDPFIHQLRALGWIEGHNITVERRFDEGKRDRLPALAAELVDLKVSVIVTAGTPAALAAKRATAAIPIVIAMVADPVRSGLVPSLARPGGNITGMAFFGPDTTQKHLELLKEAVPRATAIGVLFDPLNAAHVDFLAHDVPAAAAALSLKIHAIKVESSVGFDVVFAETVRKRVDALQVFPLGRPAGWTREVAELAIKHRLPTLGGFRSYAEQGLLMAAGPTVGEQFLRAAAYVDRLLRGARPADLPIEQPTRVEVTLNLKTAKALGLTLPPSLLLRADRVVE